MPIDELTATVQAYQPLITQIYGNLSDIGAKRSYKEALEDVAKMSEERNNYFKYKDIEKKLVNTPLTEEDMYNKSLDFDGKKLNLTGKSEMEKTGAWQDYVNYNTQLQEQNRINKEQGLTETQPIPFADYVMKNDNHKQEFMNMGLIKNNYTLKPTDEIYQNKIKRAGLTPEDFTFYQEYAKKNFQPEKYNTDLVNMMYAKAPGMISTGAMGNSLLDMFGKQVSANMINIPKLTTHVTDKYIIQYDAAGNIVKKEALTDPTKTTTDPLADTNPKDWGVEQVGDEYFYTADVFDPAKGWTSQRVRKLNDTEIANYKQQLQDEQDIRTKRNRAPRGSRRGSTNKTPDQNYIENAIKTMSRIGKLNNAKGSWNDPKAWSKEDQATYLEAANWLAKTTGMTDTQIKAAVGKWEKTGKFDPALFSNLSAGDDGSDDAGEEYLTEKTQIDNYWNNTMFDGKIMADTYRYLNSKIKDPDLRDYNTKRAAQKMGVQWSETIQTKRK